VASSPLQQIPSTAMDAAGLSITTAIRSATDPRPGAVYDPTNLAAVVPVHFHPTTSPSLGGTNFLMLSSQRWTSATVSASDPGAYTAYTSNTTPSWVQVNAATGARTTINSGFDIPMKTSGTPILTAAVSRGNDMLWTLNSVTQGDDVVAVVQHFHNNTAINVTTLNGEETIPTASSGEDTVTFSQGLHWSSSTTPYMLAYGAGSQSGQIYTARKTWARVGYSGTATTPLDTQWEYSTGTGWSSDPTAASPGPVTTIAPLSFGHSSMQRTQSGMSKGWTGLQYMSAVSVSGTAVTATVYSSLGGRPWQSTGTTVSLGTMGGTYMGGNLQFQGQVGPNPTMIDAVNSSNAVPYVYSTLSTSGGASSIVNTWGLLQVPRYS
jgi:hypothetical protein